jgi:hydrogenase expression/formation protein HypC
MCLGVPGQVVRVERNDLGMTMGVVKFGGISKEVCLMYTPEADVGDWVLVHVGFAISKLDEEQAMEVFRTLQEMGDLADLDPPQETKG